MIIPKNTHYSFSCAYILCFFPSIEDISWIETLQTNEDISLVTLPSIFKSSTSADIKPIIRTLEHSIKWILVLDSQNCNDREWFLTFMNKISAKEEDYPLFRKEFIIWDKAPNKREEILYKYWEKEIDWVRMGSTGLEPVTFCV